MNPGVVAEVERYERTGDKARITQRGRAPAPWKVPLPCPQAGAYPLG